jgi:hypothetical protein
VASCCAVRLFPPLERSIISGCRPRQHGSAQVLLLWHVLNLLLRPQRQGRQRRARLRPQPAQRSRAKPPRRDSRGSARACGLPELLIMPRSALLPACAPRRQWAPGMLGLSVHLARRAWPRSRQHLVHSSLGCFLQSFCRPHPWPCHCNSACRQLPGLLCRPQLPGICIPLYPFLNLGAASSVHAIPVRIHPCRFPPTGASACRLLHQCVPPADCCAVPIPILYAHRCGGPPHRTHGFRLDPWCTAALTRASALGIPAQLHAFFV